MELKEELFPPSRDMTSEAVGKGYYHSGGWNKDYPKAQILTIEELLDGKQPNMPPSSITFKQAERMGTVNKDQGLLGLSRNCEDIRRLKRSAEATHDEASTEAFP